MDTRFYYLQNPGSHSASEPLGEKEPKSLKLEFWKPSLFRMIPDGLSIYPFGVWWLFHLFRVFRNSEYGIVILRGTEGTPVHRSCIFPRYFRFPFMTTTDVQVGDTYTDEAYRGQGIASYVLSYIRDHYAATSRNIWYVVEEENAPSIKVAERVGFTLIGRGTRQQSRFGSLFGHYLIEENYN